LGVSLVDMMAGKAGSAFRFLNRPSSFVVVLVLGPLAGKTRVVFLAS
jgi:hypothetical protein